MEYLNIDSKILNFINFMNDDNKQITIPEPTKFIVSTKSAKCQIMSKIDLSNVAFNISKNILENIFLGHNSNYLIMGLETDNLIIRADPKYKHPFIKCMGNTLEYFNEDYYKKELIDNNKLKDSCNKKHGRQKGSKDNVHFYNSCSFLVKTSVTSKCINVKLFNNGRITLTGSKEENDGYNAVKILLEEIKKISDVFFEYECDNIEDLKIENFDITMINADFKTNFKLDLKKFLDILKTEEVTLFTKFTPERYRGLIIGYYYNILNDKFDGRCYCSKKCRGKGKGTELGMCKKVTIAIFKSGSIVITGSRNLDQTASAYKFINELLKKYFKDIIKFSILDFIDDNDMEDNSDNETEDTVVSKTKNKSNNIIMNIVNDKPKIKKINKKFIKNRDII